MALIKDERLEFLRHVGPGEHAGVFYEDEGDKISTLASMVEEKLSRGVFIFILSDDPDKLSSQLEAKGITAFSHPGSLRILDARRICLSGEGINPGLLDFCKGLVDEALNNGYKSVTGIGDYAHLLNGEHLESLAELEEKVGKKLPYDRMTAFCFICTRGISDGELLIRIIKSHSHGIFPGIALPMTPPVTQNKSLLPSAYQTRS